jgi:hypothetical protein
MTITPDRMATKLAEALPRQLKSVVLYGSAAAGDFLPGESNYNLLLLVDPLTVAELDALRAPFAEWDRAGHPTPLVFTREQLTASADAFPIELLDIQQSRKVIWGDDPLAEMRVEPRDLRLQVERELTGKLLKLRGHYALDGQSADGALELMLQSLSEFLVLFRAALRLFEGQVPEKKVDALHALAKHIAFDVRPFERLFEIKRKSAKARRPAEADVSFADYLAGIERVARAVHSHQHSPRSQT